MEVMTARTVLGLSHFPAYGQVREQLASADACSHVLFVSHRWTSEKQPDPSGRQHRAIVRLIRATADLLAWIDGPPDCRLKLVPSLSECAALQATVISVRLASPEKTRFDLDSLGIWYDYSCLPQKPRTENEDRLVQSALLGLPEFVQRPSVSLIALREAGDNYDKRGWCRLEMSLSERNSTQRGLVLRTDLLSYPLEFAADSKSTAAERAAFDTFRSAIREWKRTDLSDEEAMSCLESVYLFISFTPHLISGQDGIPAMSIAASQAPLHLVTLLVKALGEADDEFDLAELMVDFAAQVDIYCIEQFDLVFTMLVMTRSALARENPGHSLLTAWIRRHVAGERLRIMVERTLPKGSFGFRSMRWRYVEA